MGKINELFFTGKTFSRSIVITDRMINEFAELSGDYSAIHMDAAFAKEKGFDNRVAHGNILCMCFSALVGVGLLTNDVMLVSQTIKYRKPCFPGDEIELSASVASISDAVGLVELDLVFIRKRDMAKVANGAAQIKVF